MSLLSRISDKVLDFLGVSSDTQVKPAEKTSDKQAIIQCENVGKNEDAYVPEQKTNTNSKTPKKNLGAIKQTIVTKCQEHKIGLNIHLGNIGELSGLSKEKFQVLEENKKEVVLNLISKELGNIYNLQKIYGKSEKTNAIEVIKASVRNKYEAVETNAFASVEELEEAAGNINEELGNEFHKSDDRQELLKNNAKIRYDAYKEALDSELAKCKTEEEKALVIEKFEKRRKYTEMVRYNDIIATGDSQTALDAIVLLPATEIGRGAEIAIATRCDDTERTEMANNAKFEHFTGLMQSINERGEEASAEGAKSYNETMVSWKDYHEVIEYQNNYVEARKAGLPDYMPEEIFTAVAQGIGQGALNNVNMTSEQKGEFLAKWDNDASQFKSDYEQVTSQIRKEIAKNPEIANSYGKASARLDKVKNSEKVSVQPDVKNVTKETKIHIVDSSYVSNSIEFSKSFRALSPKAQNDGIKNPGLEKETTKKVNIETVLASANTFEEATKSPNVSTTDLIKTVLGDIDKYKKFLDEVIKTLKSGGQTYLAYVVNSSSDTVILTLCRELGKEKVEPLINRELCYTVKNEIENLG